MNIPNILTVSRLVVALLVMLGMALPIPFSTSFAFALFVLASITDALDGYLARHRYGITTFGKLMDPLADKVLVCAALIGFVGIRLPFEPAYSLIPAWVVVVIIAREFAVTGLRLLAANEHRIISAGNWGKLKTVGQMVAIIATFVLLVIREDILPFFPQIPESILRLYDSAFLWTSWALSAIVVLLTLISGWKYFADHLDLLTADM
jgi:CDP-diacylglycerol--glycerol-3-phosphate 3-phosphatidyltransferase